MNKTFIEYRVNFIRGRSQNILDTMLPAFASAVNEVCPVLETNLTSGLVQHLTKFFPNVENKTLNNYATEIIGQLFGMVVHNESGSCQISELTDKLLRDFDQPAFFKVLASRIQFPNPMNRKRLDYERAADDGCHVRPLVLVLEVLKELNGPATYLEIRTFVLANLLALNGTQPANLIVKNILRSRRENFTLPDPSEPNKPYHHQHIREMLGLLVLANLIRENSSGSYELNSSETTTLEWLFREKSNQALFRALEQHEDYRDFQKSWSKWYGSLPKGVDPEVFATRVDALGIDPTNSFIGPNRSTSVGHSTQEVGRIGEEIVLNWQLSEVGKHRPQDVKHVKDRSMERGIGFDIQSVWTNGDNAGEFWYLEVKTTKRATKPDAISNQLDLVNLTANEYRAAKSHGRNYSVCRVYLFSGGFEVFIITDPVAKSATGEVILEPADWSLFITEKALVAPGLQG